MESNRKKQTRVGLFLKNLKTPVHEDVTSGVGKVTKATQGINRNMWIGMEQQIREKWNRTKFNSDDTILVCEKLKT